MQIEEELLWADEGDDNEGAEQRRRKKYLSQEKRKSDPEDVNESYYANGRYRHVVQSKTHIKTTMEDE